MNWKSSILNFILNLFSKGRGTSKETELTLWKKDVIWGQYNEGQYSTYEIYFPSMKLRILIIVQTQLHHGSKFDFIISGELPIINGKLNYLKLHGREMSTLQLIGKTILILGSQKGKGFQN